MPTPVQHAEALLGAIETLKRVEEAGTLPTAADLDQLRAYPGAGPVALHLFPNPTTKAYPSLAWQQRGEHLRNLCTEPEYESLLRSTFSAFYTSATVMEAAFAVLERLGVPSTARVLEPGCGTGHFLSQAPEDMRFVGIELDLLSARIALQRFPGHDMRQGDMTGCALPTGLDAAVGNVPFADVHYDYKGVRLSLHEVCLARALDALKPGGIAALVITHSFLDRQQARFREHVAQQAELLGAIRLPSSAFADQGTAVVADLVVFQKHLAPPEADTPPPLWLQSVPLPVDGMDVPVNVYFIANPGMVLGTMTRTGVSILQPQGYGVSAPADLDAALAQATLALPAGVFPAPLVVDTEEAEEDVGVTLRPLPDGADQLPEGALYLDTDGTVCQKSGSGGVQALYSGKPLSASSGVVGQRVAALIRLREQAREVLRRQHAGMSPAERQQARALLAMQYALFVAQHGPINKTTLTATANGQLQRRLPNLAKFRDDPDNMLVAALEDYDEETGTAERAAIFLRDVVGEQASPVSVDTVEAALLASLDATGGVDIPLMADLYGQSQDAVLAALADLVYQDPTSGQWETADQYLSGNVRTKLARAEQAGPAYARNVTALQAVQPPDLLPSEIDPNLGAPWIPPTDLEAFLRHLCDAPEHWHLRVTHVAQEAVFAVDADWRFETSTAMRTTYGTNRVDGVRLFEQALNLQIPTVYDTGPTKGSRVLNLTETLAAREKQAQVKEAFKLWLWKDAARTERLVRIYNDLYNCIRLRHFDGSHLTFPGMSGAWQALLTAAQKAAIWRIMSGGNTLLAHCVGAGKTAIMMAAAMKLRQMGRVTKPLFVVPNNLLEQFIRECFQLYPNARMLLASSDDMSKRKRKLLAARIATSDWDGIITTHSAFERMGMSAGYQARYLRTLIQRYEEVLTDDRLGGRRPEPGQKNIRKRLEKQKARYEEKLDAVLAAEKKDDSLVFDELGIDYLLIDELQQFKNLETPSKLQHVAGIQTAGSQRAFDLALKLDYLRCHRPGQYLTGASGTPISNTMVEMYTIQGYLDPAGLAQSGVAHFDAWAATFGSIEEVMEIAPDGRTMRARQRFAKFVNLGELQQRFRHFADVRTQAQLQLPVPRVVGGKPAVVRCPMTPTQRRLQDALVERYEAIRAGHVKPWIDNALAVTTDGRKLALDARMLDADAGHDPAGKMQVCADQVCAIYHTTRALLATQLVFCDLGVNPTAWGFSAYEQFVDCLIKGGIPAPEIACIQEAATDAAKHHLFEQVRQGKVAVLIGSTGKMGTGTNVQHRLIALHHLDAPWKPAEVEQREGRIVRQKNMHREVYLYTYVTEGSFDSYMWQALQTKAQFIGQVMHGSLTTREVKDVDDQALTFAEVKAIATGNPAMLTLAKTEAEVRRLRMLEQHHADANYRAQQQLRLIPDDLAKQEKRLEGLRADIALLGQYTADDPWMLWDKPHTQEEAETAITEWAATLRVTYVTEDFPLGTYRGLPLLFRQHAMAQPQVLVRGAVQYDAPIDKRFGLGRSLVRAVLHLLETYPLYERAMVHDVEKQQRTLERYGASLDLPFPHAGVLAELSTLLKELRLALTEHPPEDTREAPAIVADIERLRAAQHAGPQTTTAATEAVSMAEPITAQIRARQDTQAGGI
jgi:N12 class adenine-specific DNA methylase/SAM-dependent methyltransferase